MSVFQLQENDIWCFEAISLTNILNIEPIKKDCVNAFWRVYGFCFILIHLSISISIYRLGVYPVHSNDFTFESWTFSNVKHMVKKWRHFIKQNHTPFGIQIFLLSKKKKKVTRWWVCKWPIKYKVPHSTQSHYYYLLCLFVHSYKVVLNKMYKPNQSTNQNVPEKWNNNCQ